MRIQGRSAKQLLLGALIVTIVVACAWATASICAEAYGAGPPYYGRTTNMDKWHDPTTRLLRLNGVGLLLIGALSAKLLRMRRGSGIDIRA